MTLFDNPFHFVKDRLNEIPVAQNLSANTFLIKGIDFGDTPKKVIKAFGVPNQDVLEHDIRSLLYEDDYDKWDDLCEIFERRNLFAHANGAPRCFEWVAGPTFD